MICDDARTQLTAYLDGELEGDRGSAIRGHLRGCDACRGIAQDEAALRDGLRSLPTLDAPSTMWAGVQRQLAAAEVADAEKPAWRRVLARWTPMAPRFGLAGAAFAVAAGVLVWRHHVSVTPPQTPVATQDTHDMPTPTAPTAPAPTTTVALAAGGELDVTADLAAAPARTTASYGEAADELVHLAREARAQWPDDRKQAFDTKLADLRHDVEAAAEGRPRQKAYRALIRYLQGVTIRDEIASNDLQLAAPGGRR